MRRSCTFSGNYSGNDSSHSLRLRFWLALTVSTLAAFALSTVATAKVKRIVIDKSHSESPAYGGKSFGSAGQYQRIVGRAYGELDPKDPRNAIITDIQFAPRNSRGMVEYVATFTLVTPLDKQKASETLVYQVVNRGRRPESGGSTRGYSYLFSGWQGDIPSAATLSADSPETLEVPVAHNPDGSSITGSVLTRFVNRTGSTAPLYVYTRPVPYLPATLDTRQASLTTRSSENIDGTGSAFSTVPGSDWAWADCASTPFPARPIREKFA